MPVGAREDLLEGVDDLELRAGEAAAIDVGAVGEAAPARPADAELREAVHVEVLAVERRLIDLEVAGVDDRRRAGVWIASATQSGMLCVTRMNSIVNGPTVTRSRGRDRRQPRPAVDAVLLQLRLDAAPASAACRRPGRRRSGSTCGTRADVILVAVRQHQRRDRVLLQLPQIRDDQIDAEQLGLREHHAGVDDDGRLAAGDAIMFMPNSPRPPSGISSSGGTSVARVDPQSSG